MACCSPLTCAARLLRIDISPSRRRAQSSTIRRRKATSMSSSSLGVPFLVCVVAARIAMRRCLSISSDIGTSQMVKIVLVNLDLVRFGVVLIVTQQVARFGVTSVQPLSTGKAPLIDLPLPYLGLGRYKPNQRSPFFPRRYGARSTAIGPLSPSEAQSMVDRKEIQKRP
jgi:hypothetical protein